MRVSALRLNTSTRSATNPARRIERVSRAVRPVLSDDDSCGLSRERSLHPGPCRVASCCLLPTSSRPIHWQTHWQPAATLSPDAATFGDAAGRQHPSRSSAARSASVGRIDVTFRRMEDLRDRTAVITGGARHRPGHRPATAGRGNAARAGGHRAGALQVAADELGAEAVVCDVSDAAQWMRWPTGRSRRFGAVTSCSTTPGWRWPARGEMTHEDWRWILDVDLWGPIHGVEAFLPRMVAQGAGRPRAVHRQVRRAGAQRGPRRRTAWPSTAWSPWPRCSSGSCAPTTSACRCCARCGWPPTSARRSATARSASAARSRPPVEDQSEDNPDQAGRVLDVDDVAGQVVEAVKTDVCTSPPRRERAGSCNGIDPHRAGLRRPVQLTHEISTRARRSRPAASRRTRGLPELKC